MDIWVSTQIKNYLRAEIFTIYIKYHVKGKEFSADNCYGVEIYQDEDLDTDIPDGLVEYLPEDRWIKRFVDRDDYTKFYLVYFVIDEDEITEVGAVEEKANLAFGGYMMMPGMDNIESRDYCYTEDLPEYIFEDLKNIAFENYIEKGYSFIGKKILNLS